MNDPIEGPQEPQLREKPPKRTRQVKLFCAVLGGAYQPKIRRLISNASEIP